MDRCVLIRHRLAVMIAISSGPSAALAGDAADTEAASDPSPQPRLVVESHVGERPGDAGLLFPPVRSMLQAQGHALEDAAIDARGELPRRNKAPPADVIDELGDLLDRGFRHWDEVEFSAAIDVLERALALAREHPRASTESSTMRDRLFRAHIVLALAYKRSQQINSAREAMAELVRGFVDREIPFSQFGPEPGGLRESVQAQLRGQGMSEVTIRIEGESATAVFINERFVGAGTQIQAELYPGDYRVYALTEGGPSRIRDVSVAPGETRSIDIDPRFDHALRLTPQPGLVFADEEDRRLHELDYALTLAEALGSRGGAILLRTQEREGRRVLHGKTVAPDGTTLREGGLELEESVPVEHLYALGAFLVGGAAGPEIDVMGSSGPDGDAALRGGPRFGAWSWITISVGVATLSTGVVLWQVDGRGTCWDGVRQCPRLYDTRTAGITTAVVGTALLAAGTAALTHDSWPRQTSRHQAAALAPLREGGWVVTLSGEF